MSILEAPFPANKYYRPLAQDYWPNHDHDPWLIVAAALGDSELTRLLLNSGVNPNAHNQHYETALIRAARKNHPEVIELLVHAGAEINALVKNRTALALAGGAAAVELIRLGADIYLGGGYMLNRNAASGAFTGRDGQIRAYFDKIKNNDIQGLKDILDQDPSLVRCASNPENNHYWVNIPITTPLKYALDCKHTAVAAVLIARGATLDGYAVNLMKVQDSKGHNVLDHAAVLGCTRPVIQYCARQCLGELNQYINKENNLLVKKYTKVIMRHMKFPAATIQQTIKCSINDPLVQKQFLIDADEMQRKYTELLSAPNIFKKLCNAVNDIISPGERKANVVEDVLSEFHPKILVRLSTAYQDEYYPAKAVLKIAPTPISYVLLLAQKDRELSGMKR